jgi:hypothetical protein
LFENLQDLAKGEEAGGRKQEAEIPPQIDTQQSLTSLLASLAGEAKTIVL